MAAYYSQLPPAESEMTAQDHKDEATSCFRDGLYAEALESYRIAGMLDPSLLAVCSSNSAQCLLLMKNWSEAEDECRCALFTLGDIVSSSLSEIHHLTDPSAPLRPVRTRLDTDVVPGAACTIRFSAGRASPRTPPQISGRSSCIASQLLSVSRGGPRRLSRLCKQPLCAARPRSTRSLRPLAEPPRRRAHPRRRPPRLLAAP